MKQAQSGDLLVAGRALIAPGNRHLKVKKLPLGNVALLADDVAMNGHCPSVDVLFHSVAVEFGSQAMGVLMTGMGDDGAVGLGEIRAAGGYTVAQSQETCVVFGMPKAAIGDAGRAPSGSARYFADPVRTGSESRGCERGQAVNQRRK